MLKLYFLTMLSHLFAFLHNPLLYTFFVQQGILSVAGSSYSVLKRFVYHFFLVYLCTLSLTSIRKSIKQRITNRGISDVLKR